MIVSLEGTLAQKRPARIVVNVSGVGYELFVPLCTYDRLPAEGEPCRILVYHHFTDSDQRLFGFLAEEEREMFVRLLSVSGVGPKLAVSALSGLPVQDLKRALGAGDVKRISSISGIGKKTAERIIVELRDKISKGDLFAAGPNADSPLAGDSRFRDATLALGALGYKPEAARKMVESIATSAPKNASVEDLIRRALTR